MSASVSADAYMNEIGELIERLTVTAADPVSRAADLVAARLTEGGVMQVFGTGHSQATAMELAGRAGGLIPTNRISLTDLVIYGSEPPEILADPLLERASGLASRLLDLVELDEHDLFVIVSNSGINRSIVDMATEVRRRGYPTIAITSLAHASASESRHPSGKKLHELADIVIDNLAPHGDAILPMADGGRVSAVSSVTAALVAQMLVAETVRRLQERGIDPQVYVSANLEGGHEHNLTIESKYGSRLRRWAQ